MSTGSSDILVTEKQTNKQTDKQTDAGKNIISRLKAGDNYAENSRGDHKEDGCRHLV